VKHTTRKNMAEPEELPGESCRVKSFSSSKNRCGFMPIIRCVCGAKILLTPDIAEMNHVIEKHVRENHSVAQENKQEPLPPSQVKQILVQQILKLASEMHTSTN
jgi:hypothetical protein